MRRKEKSKQTYLTIAADVCLNDLKTFEVVAYGENGVEEPHFEEQEL
jgi:hypothetical protein